MKKTYCPLVWLSLLFLPLLLPAQCEQVLAQAERDIQAQHYQRAIHKLLDLQGQRPCKRHRDEITELLKKSSRLAARRALAGRCHIGSGTFL